MRFKICTIKFALIVMIPVFLASCGSFNLFEKTAEPIETGDSNTDKINALESELTAIKAQQSELETKVGHKDEQIQKMESHISRLETKITAMEKSKRPAKPVKLNVNYHTPADLYKQARNLLLEEDYINAAALFKKFIETHPKDSLADNAVYWLGECHYSMADYKKAIQVFKELEQMYPKSEKVPDSLLKTGYSYLSLDDTNRAHHFLKMVLKKYPFSPAAEKAQEKLSDFE